MKLEPEAILFDMDGVLIDSLNSWWKSLNESMEYYKLEGISREEFISKFWGRDLQYNLRHLNMSVEILSYCNSIYSRHVDEVEIFDQTISTLEKLKSFPKAIVTNTPRVCTDAIVKKFGFDRFFDFVCTSDDVEFGKPNPEIVYFACNSLGVKPNEVILVGDTAADVEAGRSAGCKVVGVGVDADYIIEDISGLFDIIVF